MSYTYAKRKEADGAPGQTVAAKENASLDPHLDALRRGTESPTAADMGQRIDLSEAMRAKMENAFGTELSSVRLYRSQAVADAGAMAVARGSSIAFAPDKADFSTRRGQELLGHELSHVMGRARNEVSGSGYLYDAALEARADREGAMAANGEQVYSGPVTAAMSGAAPSLSMAGPMQAGKEDKARETAKSMVSAHQTRQELDTNHTKATEDQADQLVAYQRNLGDVHYFRQNQDRQNSLRFKLSRRFQRGRRVHGQLAAMRTQAEDAANNTQLSDEERTKADARKQTLSSISDEADQVTPFAPEYETLRRSRDPVKREDAYYALSDALESNTSLQEQRAITDYIETSAPNNSLLRGDTASPRYPKTEVERQAVMQKNQILSSVLDRNRLEQDMTTFRGVDDFFLRKVLAQVGFQEALKANGNVNHEWIGQNMDEFKRRMQGAVFSDPGFMSTTTNPEFAEYWSNLSGQEFARADLNRRFRKQQIGADEYKAAWDAIPNQPGYAGAHVMQVSLPKGAPAAAIDNAGMIDRLPSGQTEMLLDKGGMYEFTGIGPGKVPGSYSMQIRRLAEEEARRRRPAPAGQ